MMNAEKITLPVEQFAAHCLQTMEEVSRAGGEITLTKDGLPFMRVVPVPPAPKHFTPMELYGSMAGMVYCQCETTSVLGRG